MIPAIITIQVLTFLALGYVFIDAGQYRLGVCQLLLAVVQAVIYTGRMV